MFALRTFASVVVSSVRAIAGVVGAALLMSGFAAPRALGANLASLALSDPPPEILRGDDDAGAHDEAPIDVFPIDALSTIAGCDIVLLDPGGVPSMVYTQVGLELGEPFIQTGLTAYAMAAPENHLDPYEPCVDFFATFDPDSGMLETRFERPGTYTVCTDRNGFIEFFAVSAGAPVGGNQMGARPDGVPKLLKPADIPQELRRLDLVLVEIPAGGDNGFDAAAFRNAQVVNAPVKTIRSVQAGVNEIVARSNALGRPINVAIAGHGSPGRIGMGSGQGNGNNQEDKEFIGIGSEKNALFVQGIKDKVKGLYLFGCETGRGQQGGRALQELADKLSSPTNKVVTAAHERKVYAWTDAVGRPGGLYVAGDRANQCDISAKAKRGQ